MKKISIILCFLAALMLVFTASAENAQVASDVVYTANFEQLLPLLGEVDEDVANLFTLLGNLVKRTSGHMAIGENRYEMTYLIDNETLAGYSYVDMSNGFELYSTSIPSYVLRVTNEELEQMMTLLSTLPDAANALLEQIDLTVYSDMLGEFMASIGMESSECSETISGVLYTEKIVITVNGEQTKAFVLKALEQLGKDLEKLGLPLEMDSVVPEELAISDVGAVIYSNEEGILCAEVSGEAFGEGIVAVIYPDGTGYASVNNTIFSLENIENGSRFTLSRGETAVQMTCTVNGNENTVLIAVLNGENLIEAENNTITNEEGMETCFTVRLGGAQLIRLEGRQAIGMKDTSTSMKMYLLGAEEVFYGVDANAYDSEEEMIGYTAPEGAVVITLADLMDTENVGSIAMGVLLDCLTGMLGTWQVFAEVEPALAPYLETLIGGVTGMVTAD